MRDFILYSILISISTITLLPKLAEEIGIEIGSYLLKFHFLSSSDFL